jgi:hypothetical protein
LAENIIAKVWRKIKAKREKCKRREWAAME